LSPITRSDLFVLRFAIVLVIAAAGAAFRPLELSTPISAGLGALFAILVIAVEGRLRRASLQHLVAGALGMLLGALVSVLLLAVLAFSSFSAAGGPFLNLAVPVCFSYIGLVIGIAKAESLNLRAIALFNCESSVRQAIKLLDTSVLIDGRIADIAESGFLDGTLVLPQFVLRELQLVADSSDSAKRNRGRRGLDVVQRLQKIAHITIQLTEEDVPNVREVDLKLIELAKVHRCRIVTNDFNLNKVAQVHGVSVLNINELANALKPVVLPGEAMRVFILKEGKEHNQGVAYLDDGTMVVVDNARRQISRTIDITVTSVLQTTAGKMIFGRFDERASDRPVQISTPERHSASSSPSSAPAHHAAAGAGKESVI
jgi:uncharacterized protein YacL